MIHHLQQKMNPLPKQVWIEKLQIVVMLVFHFPKSSASVVKVLHGIGDSSVLWALAFLQKHLNHFAIFDFLHETSIRKMVKDIM